MRILVTGITGLVGQQIRKICKAMEVDVHYLTTREDQLEDKEGYQGFYWDPVDGQIDHRCLHGVEAIIHLAGANVAKPWTKSYKQEIIDSRVKSTQLLVDTLKENQHSVQQVVSASAIGIYGSSLTKLHQEDSDYLADDFLGQVVKRWEASVDGFKSLHIPVCKLRIGMVLSRDGGALEKIVKPINNYIGAPIGSGNQWQSWIHIYDLASMFLFAVEADLDGVYNAVAPNPVTNKKMTQLIANQLDKPLIAPNVPKFVLKMMLGEMANIVLASQLVTPNKIKEEGFNFDFKDLKTALEEIYPNKLSR